MSFNLHFKGHISVSYMLQMNKIEVRDCVWRHASAIPKGISWDQESYQLHRNENARSEWRIGEPFTVKKL